MKSLRLMTILMALLLVLTACSPTAEKPPAEDPPATEPATTEEVIRDLLTRDYIVGYLWYCDGLSTTGELTEDEYLPVAADSSYPTLQALQQLVEGTYTAETAALLISATDREGRPQFIEREGKLYKSSQPVFSRYYWDYAEDSIEILSETAAEVTFTVQMNNLHTGEWLPVELTMQNTSAGWRLTAVSLLMAESSLTQSETMATRTVAEEFAAALVANDPAAIARCAGEAEDLYQNWLGMTIPEATLTDVLEEYDGYGRYRVHMDIDNAFGVFAAGEEDYILIVQEEAGQQSPVVCYFEPEEKVAYNFAEERGDAACEMTMRFLESQGGMRFKNTFWLDRATVTDFALTMLYATQPDATAYSEETVTAAAQQYLGLIGFEPSETYLGAEGYLLPGRAARSMPHLLIWPSYPDGTGYTMVKAEIYSDHLNTQNCKGYLFRYLTNADGSLCLVSVT